MIVKAKADIAARLSEVRDRIEEATRRAGRAPGCVKLVAVSKGQNALAVAEAVRCGQRDFGENYVQELVQKMEDTDSLAMDPSRPSSAVNWHFIGHVQRNKLNKLAGRVAGIESVNRPKLVSELDRRWQATGRPLDILIEVNIGQDPHKSGVLPSGALDLATQIVECKCLCLQGLMAIPPRHSTARIARQCFQDLRSLRDKLEVQLGRPIPELSMGMSADYEIAIEEGATRVRLGTAIFGPRD